MGLITVVFSGFCSRALLESFERPLQRGSSDLNVAVGTAGIVSWGILKLLYRSRRPGFLITPAQTVLSGYFAERFLTLVLRYAPRDEFGAFTGVGGGGVLSWLLFKSIFERRHQGNIGTCLQLGAAGLLGWLHLGAPDLSKVKNTYIELGGTTILILFVVGLFFGGGRKKRSVSSYYEYDDRFVGNTSRTAYF